MTGAMSQLLCQRLKALDAPRAQHNGCPLRRKKSGSRLAQAAARTREDEDFPFDVIVHNLDSLFAVKAAQKADG
jgi:hypothetical protein